MQTQLFGTIVSTGGKYAIMFMNSFTQSINHQLLTSIRLSTLNIFPLPLQLASVVAGCKLYVGATMNTHQGNGRGLGQKFYGCEF
eukprot:snap_masked-scaffold_27-processed-gene-1.44-mRNA-1 protein AED:1.00 eAED:1.00 QI:0/0/0/0/1/1/2/0/84